MSEEHTPVVQTAPLTSALTPLTEMELAETLAVRASVASEEANLSVSAEGTSASRVSTPAASVVSVSAAVPAGGSTRANQALSTN